jgi:hypothetical protein
MLRSIALTCDSAITPYNPSLEGGRILRYRKQIESPSFAKDADILFVGTSRTMADYDPDIFAQTLSKNIPLPYTPSGRNLGNLGNAPTSLEAYLNAGKLRPKILVLEFSPHIFSLKEEKPLTQFDNYRSTVMIQDLLISGWTAQILGLENTWAASYLLATLLNPTANHARTCVEKQMKAYQYGQRLRENGQVYYRVYLPDWKSTKIAREHGFVPLEYKAFQDIYLVGKFRESEWEAYKRIIQSARSKGVLVIVVRPAVAPELYDLENQKKRVVDTVTQYLAKQNVVYVDLNPNDYHSLDMSHIDWYDTPRLSADLALKIIPLVDWQKFSP